jgi:hypothetical protein
MSRSTRKRPWTGVTTAKSEKRDKILAHRRLRAATRLLERLPEIREAAPGLSFPIMREVSDVWSFAKDGKTRINPTRFPNLMRK